jgi:fibulin 1/2
MDVTSDENNCGTCGHHCGPGFTCQNGTCEDLDECLTDNPCQNGRSCSNEEGGYSCGPCGSGLTESGDGCADVNECLNDNGGCNSLRECVNSFGGVSCGPCVTGYTLDGADCVDVNECLTDNGGCDPLRQCVNGVGSSSCGSCASGYQPSGARDCADVNECLTDNGGCAALRACVNATGSSSCGACSAGYQPSGATECADIDECDTNNGGCSALRQCVNTTGSSSCGACASGYQPSGLTQCMDVNECLTNNGGCHAQRSCINGTGSFSCGNCSAGYANDGPLGCADVDECLTANGGCDPLRTCVNQVGSSSCGACAAGYAPVGPTACGDINECLTANGGCHPTRACTNSIGGFTCGACGSGYVNSGPLDCADVNECAIGNGGCAEVCINFDGGHSCACNPGSRMELDGVTCTALSWNTASMIQASGGTVSSASVAYDTRDLAIVVMAQTQSGNRNVLSRRYSPASGFTSASAIETESVNDIQYLGIDMNRGGDAVAVWAQPASGDYDLRANRYRPGNGWDGAGQVESNTSGYAEAPSVAVDLSATAHVVRAQSGRVVYAQRPMGSGWTGDFMIDATPESDTIPLMKMGISAGMAIWSEQSGAVRALVARPFAAGTFGAQTLVSAMGVDTTTHALAVADDGDALVVWLQQSAANHDLWGRRYEPGVGWHAPALIDQYDGTAPSTLDLGAEGNTGYHVVWTQQTADTRHHVYSRRYLRGQGFAATVEVSPSSTDRGTVALAVAPSGDAVATWFEGSDVRASRYLVGVGWTSAVRLSTTTGGTLLYNRVAISDAGNAIVLWGHSPSGTWNLWAATLD